MQQRYYEPYAARFLSVDPVTADSNTGSSFNRYFYTNNNPYKYIDPDGRDSDSTFEHSLSMCRDSSGTNCGIGSSSGTGSANQSQSQSTETTTYGDESKNISKGLLVTQGPRRGLVEWWHDPQYTFSASPGFVAQFTGSPAEVALAATVVMASAGARPYETLKATDVGLPGRKTLYDIYVVGEPVGGRLPPGRLANVRGSNEYFYSPYHYKPGPGVPDVWVKFTYSPKGGA